MPQGLVCIALAAAHLEAQREKGTETIISQSSDQPSPTGSGVLAALRDCHDAVRVVSNGTDSSDDDTIDDPEEMLATILDEQPKEVPPAPSADDIISSVQPDDVLCGRGGETNHHPGNVQYRGLVKKYQRLYLKAKRRDKPKIARLIVDTVRRRTGRFLKKDQAAGVWRDVGNNKAREKTSQALREGAPEIRDHDTKRKSVDGNVVTPNSSTGSLVPITDTLSKFSGADYNIMHASKKTKTSTAARPTSWDEANATVSSNDPSKDVSSEDARNTGGPRLKFLKSRLSMESETPLQQEMV